MKDKLKDEYTHNKCITLDHIPKLLGYSRNPSKIKDVERFKKRIGALASIIKDIFVFI